ncbi:STAS domain-containing protein [Pseudalkalibacillus caeni]|uniref:STAS domain-containing protein n=1 Tax=Exobacillus caeni TaxID=2574798 RepID=A0A5R9F0Z0_9BACL|nr:STAS domain-containing protein [Pseudalkalibacillus caeni]TLS36090.1 STAS domain-containing protein [Pseudalkalibacillus caeni]
MEKDRSNYINELELKLKEYEVAFEEISSPIIPSIIPNTILVPLTGQLTVERFENIRQKLLSFVKNNPEVDAAIIDFTGINNEDISSIGYEKLANEIHQVANALQLMGVEAIYAGFKPKAVQSMVLSGIDLDLTAHANFRKALEFLMKKKGLQFVTNAIHS